MIVITGGGGFIGSTLAKNLEGHELIIVDTFLSLDQKNTLSMFPVQDY